MRPKVLVRNHVSANRKTQALHTMMSASCLTRRHSMKSASQRLEIADGYQVDTVVAVTAVGLLAGAVAAAELGSRFHDDPLRVIRSPPGLVYLAINSLLSIGLLLVAIELGWRFGVAENAPDDTLLLTQVLVVGLGSVLLLRSSFFTIRVQGEDVGVGPNTFVTALLSIVERTTDRRRANERLDMLPSLTSGLSFARDYAAIVEISSYSLQRLDLAEADALGTLARA